MAHTKRMPLDMRMALLRNQRERGRPLPPPVVECGEGDSVIVALEGLYVNAVVVSLPWYSDDARYKRVKTNDGRTARVRAHDIVKVEEGKAG